MMKMLRFVSGGRTVVAVAAVAFGLANASGASLGPTGNYYEVFTAPGFTWGAAKSAAEALGGYLATVTSAQENDFIDSLRVGSQLGQVWLGGYQSPPTSVPTANWVWLNGEGSFSGVNGGSTYSNWGAYEPNDYYGPGSESRLAMGLFGNSTWNDEGNLQNIAGYVVEYGGARGVPEASSAFAAVLALGFGCFLRRRFANTL